MSIPRTQHVLEESGLMDLDNRIIVRDRARVACIGRKWEPNFDADGVGLKTVQVGRVGDNDIY